MRLRVLLSVLAATAALTTPAAADLVDEERCVADGCVTAYGGAAGAEVAAHAAPNTCSVVAETCGSEPADGGSAVAAPSAGSPISAKCTWTKTRVTLTVSIAPSGNATPEDFSAICRVYVGTYLRGSVTATGWGTTPATATAPIGPGPTSRGCINVNVRWSQSSPSSHLVTPRCIPDDH